MSAQPRLGCGAAIVQDGRLLLVRRLREPEAGCWEVGLTSPLWQGGAAGSQSLRQAYTFSDFHYRDNDEFSGNRLPGLPRHYYQAGVRYDHPSGFYAGLNTQYDSKVAVDYANSYYAYATFGATVMSG